MSTPVGPDVWRDLFERLVAQKQRLLETGGTEADTCPNPGAAEAQLATAERRLGRPLAARYRELLSIADGWDYFYLSFSLLGSADIGVGPRWESGLQIAQLWFDDEEWGEEIGANVTAADFQPLVTSDNGYSNTAFLFIGDSDVLRPGSVVELPIDEPYPDLYSYLVTQIDEITMYG
ncbi:SMI1/KNR4 family protein [Nocardia jejuensis]|uniref:SMI1/KNR4 family protein n=1 Tax=Nocardia jejuensis TaxID=328049 RepID=UPI0012FAB2F7|nr:SMI1/KNR4 family protein [Nocardia jejuensis]